MKKILGYHQTLKSYEDEFTKLNSNHAINRNSHITSTYTSLLKYFSKTINNNKCTISWSATHRVVSVFKLNPNNIPELILDFQLTNFTSNFNEPFPLPLDLKIQYYISNHSISWELDKLKTLGKISNFILTSQTKFLPKLNLLFQRHHHTNLKINKKVHILILKYKNLYLKYQTLLYPIFLKNLHLGIEYNPKYKKFPNISFPNVPLSEVLKIKLIKSNEFLVTFIKPSNPKVGVEYKIKVDDPKTFICQELLKLEFIDKLKIPLF